eukprot:scaffold1588_cov40-Attheya_sp.AAC.1
MLKIVPWQMIYIQQQRQQQQQHIRNRNIAGGLSLWNKARITTLYISTAPLSFAPLRIPYSVDHS